MSKMSARGIKTIRASVDLRVEEHAIIKEAAAKNKRTLGQFCATAALEMANRILAKKDNRHAL